MTGSVKPSSAKSDTSSVRPRKVSFDVVRDQGKSDLGGQPLKVVQSTPSLKKGGSPRKFILGKEAGFFPSLWIIFEVDKDGQIFHSSLDCGLL